MSPHRLQETYLSTTVARQSVVPQRFVGALHRFLVMVTMSSHEGCQSQQGEVFANHLDATRNLTSGRGEECQEDSETAASKQLMKEKKSAVTALTEPKL